MTSFRVLEPRWEDAIIYPDSTGGWNWAFEEIFFIPAIVRLLAELKKKNVKRVYFVNISDSERNRLQSVLREIRPDKIPETFFCDTLKADELGLTGPILLVLGGFLWQSSVLQWFHEKLLSQNFGSIVLRTETEKPILASCDSEFFKKVPAFIKKFPPRDVFPVSFSWPSHIFCKPVEEFSASSIEVLNLVGKPSDRPHVVFVRKVIFPFLRLCAAHHIHPNIITWIGFYVHLMGCACIAFGGYLMGILGSIFLILSWVVDCADGSLARLTLQESHSGAKLDTRLGHLSNLTFFAALLIRCWNKYSILEFAFLGILLFGGITIAARTHAQTTSLVKASNSHSKLPGFLVKINHRDYAFVVLLFAITNMLPAFLWIGTVGVYLFVLAEIAVLGQSKASNP